MRLFEGRRPQAYFDGGKLFKDKKTDKQMWQFKVVIRCEPDDMAECDDVILKNYIAIETRENQVEEIVIACSVPEQAIEFFGLEDHTAPLLYVRADCTDVSITREKDLTQLHFKIEIENSHVVHEFVRNYVFTSVWMQFADLQRSLPIPGPKAKAKGDNSQRVN